MLPSISPHLEDFDLAPAFDIPVVRKCTKVHFVDSTASQAAHTCVLDVTQAVLISLQCFDQVHTTLEATNESFDYSGSLHLWPNSQCSAHNVHSVVAEARPLGFLGTLSLDPIGLPRFGRTGRG